MVESYGKKNCPKCKGEGFFVVSDGSDHPPSIQSCRCVLHLEILDNVERGMKGLTKAPPIKSSPLSNMISEDTWITAEKSWFTAHLRHVAIRRPPNWFFKVVSDVDLMTAWLASVSLKGQDILDPDVHRKASKVSLSYLTLVDLIEPPALLIVRLGIKVARNAAMPEVMMETLAHRSHIGKPTWLWDQPNTPLGNDHMCYSTQLLGFISDWRRVRTQKGSSQRPKGLRQTLSEKGNKP